ncbi:Transposase IS116/IS110/IS902 family protein [Mesorhizobium sp. NFR06]|nr:Transposase IS116/IS110/IS902 family protein [Mesorhizobium sp. NFR06]
MRTDWFRQPHIKLESCYRTRLLLTHRRNLKAKFLDLENVIRQSLKAFGIRLGKTGRGAFAKAVLEAVAGDPMTHGLMQAMLRARAVLWTEYLVLHRLVVRLAMRAKLCRRFMMIPGVSPITALSFSMAIENPARFRRSRDVAAYGLTSKRWQSGTSIDVKGRISKAGDGDVRRALYEAASAMLTRFKGSDLIKAWGLRLAKTKCHAKARVAVARKRAVVMRAMWRDGTSYVGDTTGEQHDIDAGNIPGQARRPYRHRLLRPNVGAVAGRADAPTP